MATVKNGDTIRIHYTGRFEDGTVFDSSRDGASLEMTIGSGEFIRGLEEGVIGMAPGDSRTIPMPPEKAYGPHSSEKVFQFHHSRLPEGFDAQIGQQLQMYRADGMPIQVTVVGKDAAGYMFDANHPMAGKTLIFEVFLEEIVEKE